MTATLTATLTAPATVPTVAHDVIRVGDRVYYTPWRGGLMRAVVHRADEHTLTGFMADLGTYGVVTITARNPTPGYHTGETLVTNDIAPRTGWHTSNGRYYRVGVSCLEWRPCEGCGRTTRLDEYAVKLRHDAGTVTVAGTVVNGDRGRAVEQVCDVEGAPRSAVESVILTRVRYV